MPSRPPLHRPLGHAADARARTARERERQALRPSAAERGYDDDWRRLRAEFLAANPWCVVPGCGKPATDVDHLHSIIDRPDLRLDRANLRSMCHRHHSQRTAREQSFVHGPKLGQRHPPWLRRSIVPITLVCGPPGSGKTTLVGERAQPTDMVLDPERIAATLSGFPVYEAPDQWREQALRWRNSRLQLLSFVSSRWKQAWLLSLEPQASGRLWWREHVGVANVIVLETDQATCLDRIANDPERSARARQVHAGLVEWWWRSYERCDADIVLRPGERATTGRALRG